MGEASAVLTAAGTKTDAGLMINELIISIIVDLAVAKSFTTGRVRERCKSKEPRYDKRWDGEEAQGFLDWCTVNHRARIVSP